MRFNDFETFRATGCFWLKDVRFISPIMVRPYSTRYSWLINLHQNIFFIFFLLNISFWNARFSHLARNCRFFTPRALNTSPCWMLIILNGCFTNAQICRRDFWWRMIPRLKFFFLNVFVDELPHRQAGSWVWKSSNPIRPDHLESFDFTITDKILV